MFYEAQHSLGAVGLHTDNGRDFRFPPHLHESFEMIAVTEGRMRVRVGNTVCELGPGDGALVFPNQVHSLETVEHSRHYLWIFRTDFVKAFVPFCRDHTPQSPLFRPSEDLLSRLLALKEEDGIYRIKSVLYALVDEFSAAAVWCERVKDREALLLRIFDYVNRHYGEECTLKSLSGELAYHYAYLSRYFMESTGTSFTDYVNATRIGESCYRLINTDDSVTKIALECGFESLRSFHRNFKERMGQTPVEYRNGVAQEKKEGLSHGTDL